MSLIFLVLYLFLNLGKTGEARPDKQLKLPQPLVLPGVVAIWQNLTQVQLRKFCPNRNTGVTSLLLVHPWGWYRGGQSPVPRSRQSEQHGQLHKKKCFPSLSLRVGGAETVTWCKSGWERGFLRAPLAPGWGVRKRWRWERGLSLTLVMGIAPQTP